MSHADFTSEGVKSNVKWIEVLPQGNTYLCTLAVPALPPELPPDPNAARAEREAFYAERLDHHSPCCKCEQCSLTAATDNALPTAEHRAAARADLREAVEAAEADADAKRKAAAAHHVTTTLVPALPTDSQARKDTPLARGLLDYFPAALAAVARVSKRGNDKHNPGEPMQHARGKSSDHADCILRHLMDRGTIDPEDGQLHSAKVAWRALAMLQEELEAAGAPMARGAKK